MFKTLLTIIAGCCFSACVLAQAPLPLDDAELAQVSGGDGVSFALRLALNDPALPGAVADSRLSMGFNVDGRNTYLVVRNLRGTIDMFGMGLDVQKKPDGSSYIAVTLPGHVRYTNFGFDSLSVQADPLAPVTESLGRFNLNGTLSMQGQFRFWAH